MKKRLATLPGKMLTLPGCLVTLGPRPAIGAMILLKSLDGDKGLEVVVGIGSDRLPYFPLNQPGRTKKASFPLSTLPL